MTRKTEYNLFKRAEGTNAQFHSHGQLIEAEIVTRTGLGKVYVIKTDNPQVARHLQIVHGFKIEIPVVRNVPNTQVKVTPKAKEVAPEKSKKTPKKDSK